MQPADSIGLASSLCSAFPIAAALTFISPFFFVRAFARAPGVDTLSAGRAAIPARRWCPTVGRAVEMRVPADVGMPARRRSSACKQVAGFNCSGFQGFRVSNFWILEGGGN